MLLKIFTQPNCPKCPAAKAVVKQVENKVKIENYDIKTVEGLTEALEYDVLSTPSIIILDHDNNILGRWNGETPLLEDLNKILK